jgi:transposase
MTRAFKALPDDLEMLKAMLIAERIRSDRLVQIIKDMQRHRFGRRAETLPADQLLLALEDLEQNEAEASTEAEAGSRPLRGVQFLILRQIV